MCSGGVLGPDGSSLLLCRVRGAEASGDKWLSSPEGGPVSVLDTVPAAERFEFQELFRCCRSNDMLRNLDASKSG
jgi:hypothetical protein